MASQNNNTTIYDIRKFLEEHIVEKGNLYTHTSMGKPFACYSIKNNELDNFYFYL